jgi:hypothetical protein
VKDVVVYFMVMICDPVLGKERAGNSSDLSRKGSKEFKVLHNK